MPDILNTRAPTPDTPRPHPVIDALVRAGRAAAARRDAHHAETLAIMQASPPPASCAHVLRRETGQ